jgi:YbgC/YbaW family acyl-CoA thioester hydrolase
MSDVRRPEVRVQRRVLFSETDVAGIVHFSNYFRYFEDAEHALWREAGLSVHPDNPPVGWPRVAATCNFHRALKFEQEFEVIVHIREISRRTITYAGEIFSRGEKVATGSWKIASIVKLPDGTMRSVEVPPTVAESLKPFVFRTSDLGPRTSEPE